MTDEQTNDNELMEMIKHGRKSAMKLLVERYKRKAYYLALGMVGNSDEALDISQDAFIRVFKSARRFDSKQRFFSWFFSIVTNLCRDTLKRRKNRDARMVDIDDSEFLLIDKRNPETTMIKKEEAGHLRKAIMMLDIDDRRIIMLKHFHEASYDEIAGMLDIPKGTVMSRLYYARKKLAKLLNERM